MKLSQWAKQQGISYRTAHRDECGLVLDRDVNAAINMARLAESGSVLGRGAERKTKEPSGSEAVGVETSTSRELVSVSRGPVTGNGSIVSLMSDFS